MTKGRDKDHGSAAELLSDWRSAERDSAAAREARDRKVQFQDGSLDASVRPNTARKP
jgi:hypothetical protein